MGTYIFRYTMRSISPWSSTYLGGMVAAAT